MDTKAVPVNLLTFLDSDKHKSTVEAIRRETDKTKKDLMKASLPCITPSGTFSPSRKESNLKQHSGFICLDIDLKGNERIGNYTDLKTQIAKIPQVAYCGLSVSGNGYFVLIMLTYPEKHLQHFMALQRIFGGIGIVVDKVCKDVCRLRGYSYDKEAYYNHAAIPFKTFDSPVIKPSYASVKSCINQHYSDDSTTVEMYLSQIEKHGIDITGNYNEWFSIGCNFASTFGESGRDYFHKASLFNNGYTYLNTDNKYNDCLKANKSQDLGTFINRCKDYGLTISKAVNVRYVATVPIKQPIIAVLLPLVDLVPIVAIEVIQQYEEPPPIVDYVNDAVTNYQKLYSIKNMPPDKYFLSYGISIKKLLKGQTAQSFTDAALCQLSNQQPIKR